ncbi:hypothetical protein OROHE_021921 [Orobanche hederae]
MAADLVLDDWVLIPLSVVMVLIGLLRLQAHSFFSSTRSQNRQRRVILRARNLRAAANLIPAKSFRARKAYYTNEV